MSKQFPPGDMWELAQLNQLLTYSWVIMIEKDSGDTCGLNGGVRFKKFVTNSETLEIERWLLEAPGLSREIA